MLCTLFQKTSEVHYLKILYDPASPSLIQINIRARWLFEQGDLRTETVWLTPHSVVRIYSGRSVASSEPGKLVDAKLFTFPSCCEARAPFEAAA